MARVLLILALASQAIFVLLLAALQVPGIGNWAGQRLLGLIPLNPDYELTARRVTGNWVTHLELQDVLLRHASDTVAELGLVAVAYNPFRLLTTRRLQSLQVAGGRIVARRNAEGWDLQGAVGSSATPATDTAASGGSFGIGRLEVRDVALSATLAPDSVAHVRDLIVRGGDLVFGDRIQGRLDTLRAAVTPPGTTIPMTIATRGIIARDVIRLDSLDIRSEHSRVAGRAVIPRQLNDPRQAGQLYVNLRAAPLSLVELARFYPAVVPRGELNALITAQANGSVVNGEIAAEVDGATLHIAGSSLLGVDAPVALHIDGELTGFDPARVIRNAPAGRITGSVSADLAGERLTTSDGDFTLRVEQRRHDGAPLRVNASGKVTGGRADLQLRAALNELAVAANASLRPFDTLPTYRLHGTARQGELSGRFVVHGTGVTPDAANATARVDLDRMVFNRRAIDSVVANARLQDGNAVVRVTGRVARGRLTAVANARPFDPEITFSLDSALLDRADLGTLLDRPDFAGPLTVHAQGKGTLGGATPAMQARLKIDPTKLRGVEITEGVATLQMKGERIEYQASFRTSGGTIAARGDITGPRFVAHGQVDSLDAGVFLGRPDLDTRIAARFDAEGSGSSGKVELQVLESRVRTAQLGPGTVRGQMEEGRVTGSAHFTAGDLLLDVAVSRTSAKGTLELRRLERWLGDTALAGGVSSAFDIRLATDSAGITGAAGTLAAHGTAGAMRLDTLRIDLGPDSGLGINVDTLLVRSNFGTVDGGGRLPLRESTGNETLRLVAFSKDVAPIARATNLTVSLDSARASVTVSGPAERRSVVTQAHGWRVLYSKTVVEQLDASVLATVQGMTPDSVIGRIAVRGLASGTLTIRQAEAVGWYDSALVFAGSADLGHGVHLATAVSGGYRGGNGSLHVERLDFTEGGRQWGLNQPARITVRGRRLELQDFQVQSGDRFVAATGVVDMSGTSDFTANIEQLDLGEFQRAGLVPLAGLVDGSIQLSGPAAAPALQSSVSLTLPERDDYHGGVLRADVRWSRREMRLEASAESRGSRLAVNGVLPWGFTLASAENQSFAVLRQQGDSLDIAISADTFEIAVFEPFVTSIDHLRGQLHADARIAGTPEDPVARGSLRLEKLDLRLPQIDVRYEDSRFVAALDGSTLRIDTLLLHTDDDEWLLATGRLSLRPLTNPAISLGITLHDFVLSAAGTLEASAAGQIVVAGTFAEPKVTGSLVMGHTEMHVSESGSSGGMSLAAVELSETDRLVLARHFGARALARVDRPVTFLDPFALELELRLPEQVWFRRGGSPKIDVEVTGTVRLRQQPQSPMEFFGTVEPLAGRSTLDVFGRKFDLVGGEIVLDGPIEAARIRVNAEYHPPMPGGSDEDAVLINVVASGRTDSLALDFSSTPSMPRDDIISYVVTGRPASDNPLIGGSGQGIQGDELAFGQLSDALSEVVSQRLGFEVFQLRLDGSDGMVLNAGRYLTPKFFVSLQQPLDLGSDAAERTPGTNLGPGFELQYRLQTWLRLNLRGGSLPAGVQLRGRYAY